MVTNVRNMVLAGLAMATVYSAYVLLLYAIRGPAPFESSGVTVTAMVGAYFAGGLVAGTIVGLLWPLVQWRVGAILVGILAGFAVFVGIGVAAEGWPWSWEKRDWLSAVLCSILLGGICANISWQQSKKD